MQCIPRKRVIVLQTHGNTKEQKLYMFKCILLIFVMHTGCYVKKSFHLFVRTVKLLQCCEQGQLKQKIDYVQAPELSS